MPTTKFVDPFGPKSRVATAIPSKLRKGLESESWRVYTEDKITQDAIAEHLAEQGEGCGATESIFYDGKAITVFIVQFAVVMFLKNNKSRGPYTFSAYHRPAKTFPWRLWKEGRKAPGEVLRRKLTPKKGLPIK